MSAFGVADRFRLALGRKPGQWTPDLWRRWQAAGDVTDGVERVHVAAWLARSRECHAFAEGLETPE